MGRFHYRVLSDLGFDVTTVDPDPTAGADYLTVPAGKRPETVCVAVPMDHLAETAAGFAGQTRALLIEKPGATSEADARELAGLLSGEHVAVGYVERFNPQVRALARALADSPPPTSALCRRWNNRPTADVALDLVSHDVDLVRHLGLGCPVAYEAGGCPVRVREIIIRTSGRTVRTDLMAHSTSPLHAQWHAFLSKRQGYATLTDAVHVLSVLSERAMGATA